MKKFILVALAIAIIASPALAGPKVFGYMNPRFAMIDKGEDMASNLGFSTPYNRFAFKGEVEGGEIMKKMGYRLDLDVSTTGGNNTVIYAYMDAYFSDNFCVRMGRMKKSFSREFLHNSTQLLTTGRHYSGRMAGLQYGSYSYGMEARVKQEKWYFTGGLYDGSSAAKGVANQDPAIDIGGRVVATPAEGVEVGANVMMVSLPDGGVNNGTYVDGSGNAALQTNSGFAFGVDAEYKKAMGEGSLWLEGEFDSGDNWMCITNPVDDNGAPTPWEDQEFGTFSYMYLRALYMINAEFGVHFGYSMYDPDTDTDDDASTLITPGVTYVWNKKCSTKVEVQLESDEFVDMNGNSDTADYTHFILQTIFVWG